MIEFYPQIKQVHVACVFASVMLFVLRGGLLQAGYQQVAFWPPLRYLSYGIDTVLLSAALMLLTILPGAVFANHWLSVKLVLLVAYVVLGSFALRRGRSPAMRRACLVAAVITIALMYGIARAHHPLGFFQPWLT